MTAAAKSPQAKARAARTRDVNRKLRESAQDRALQAEAMRVEALGVATRMMASLRERLDQSDERRAKVEASDRNAHSFRNAADRDNWDTWRPRSLSADEDLDQDREILVRRARDCERNDPIGGAVIEAINRHVMGGGPWTVQSTARPDRLAPIMGEARVKEWQQRCEDGFEEAAEKLDGRGEMDFWPLLGRLHRSKLGGDCFAQIATEKKRRGRETRVRIWTHEGDLCRSPMDKWDDRTVRHGVQFTGRVPTGYYLFDEYQDSRWNDPYRYTFVPREDKAGRPQMLHMSTFGKCRLNQSRGLPVLTNSIGLIEDTGATFDNRLIAQRAQSCVALVIENMVPLKQGQTPPEQILEPGMQLHLGPDQKAVPFLPHAAASDLRDFLLEVQKIVCASIGFAAMLAMHDFTQANYSVARMTLLDGWKYFGDEQVGLARYVRRIWRAVIEDLWTGGHLPGVPLFASDGSETPYTAELLRCEVIPPSMGWIDPTQEVDAYEKAVKAGFTTRRAVISMTSGRGHEEVFRDLGEEQRLMEQEGVPAFSDTVAAPKAAAQPEDAGDEAEEPAPAAEQEEEEVTA